MLHPSIASATHEFSLVETPCLCAQAARTAPCMVQISVRRGLRRGAHDPLQATTFHGQRRRSARYHALNPDVFFFGAATYVDALFTCVDVFFGGLTEPMREQLYAETCEWYRRFGISSRVMPRPCRVRRVLRICTRDRTRPEPGVALVPRSTPATRLLVLQEAPYRRSAGHAAPGRRRVPGHRAVRRRPTRPEALCSKTLAIDAVAPTRNIWPERGARQSDCCAAVE